MTNPTPHGQVPEALRLADLLLNLQTHMGPRRPSHPDDAHCWDGYTQSSAELRRLHAQVAALTAAPQGAAYAELPEPDATTVGLGAVWNRHSMRDFADRTHALRAQQPAPATQKLTEQICISDTNQSAACAVGNVGTTSDAQTTRSTHDSPATKQVGDVVAYLDIGAGGYLDLGSALSDEALQQLPKGRHALVIAGTYGIDGYVAAPPPPALPHAPGRQPATPAAKTTATRCPKCMGAGRISSFQHVKGGECFSCGGSGLFTRF